MTMDVKQSRMNVKIAPPLPDHHQDHQHLHQHVAVASKLTNDRKTTTKRSFDVAFLMLPDEKLTRNAKPAKRPLPPAPPSPTIDVESDSTQSEDLSVKGGFSPIRSPEVERHFPLDMLSAGRQRALLVADGLAVERHTGALIHHHPQQHPQHHHPHHQPLQPPVGSEERLAYLFNTGARFYEHPFGAFGRSDTDAVQRSAFQKVSSAVPTDSPLPPLSPDRHSCPSTSPPISISPSSSQTGSVGGGFRSYEYGPFLSPSPGSSPSAPAAGSPSAKANGCGPVAATGSPLPMLYRPADPSDTPMPGAGYFPGVPPFALPPFAGGGPAAAPPIPEAVDGIIRNPAAAAILSTLLPSAMSTFTLSAQNVCAKCNISFRMTSDLVYHMRSHHKSEHVHDHARRKREDKLKCPVCNESFRERHHLTRHMTAHQDKAGDLLEKAPPGANGKGAAASRHQQQQQQQQQQHHHHHQPHLHIASPGRLA
ncbi:PR domain zinc finger protein 8 [Anopheles gambiae]|uniref:C2H2-type domain-containing protein n=1 Tax=Anopheles coluzzii TaxID=1518534 RepID=A0A6E8VRZ4_ANOCL|nr:PR domain zinc finger protein 8 [Anopheles gambiae]